MKDIKKKKKLSVGPEVVLLMRRGRTMIDKKKQGNKMACRFYGGKYGRDN